jgi:gluconate 2-dehydrogenase alpha chain
VAIERGPWRDTATDFPPAYAQDELRYHIRHDLFLRPAQLTMTFRNSASETALPIRSWGSFMPPNGVGGGGVHWNAETWRFLPSDFQMKTHLTERYGEKFLPEDMTIQDWGITYDELEPYYDKFEYLCGTSGKAGNIKGQIQTGGNPFEGARAREYPTPPQKQPYGPTLFAQAAKEMGYKPFPQPSGNLSQAYTNPLGVTLGPCTYCGFCEWFGCGNYSKASPQTTILPALVRQPNFEARTQCEVLKINLDGSGKRATGVTYVDTSGNEMGAAGRSRAPLRLPAVQRASAFDFRNRQAIRSARQRGRDRSQLFLSGHIQCGRLFRRQDLQPVYRLGLYRDVHR